MKEEEKQQGGEGEGEEARRAETPQSHTEEGVVDKIPY